VTDHVVVARNGFFSFAGASDSLYAQYYGDDVVQMIVEDRKSMYSADVLRSIILVLLTALTLVLYQYKKIPQWGMQVAILALIFFDLGGVARRYVNKDSFADRYMVNNPFEMTPSDQQILKDNSEPFKIFISIHKGHKKDHILNAECTKIIERITNINNNTDIHFFNADDEGCWLNYNPD